MIVGILGSLNLGQIGSECLETGCMIACAAGRLCDAIGFSEAIIVAMRKTSPKGSTFLGSLLAVCALLVATWQLGKLLLPGVPNMPASSRELRCGTRWRESNFSLRTRVVDACVMQ